MKIIKADEYNIIMIFDAQDEAVFFGNGSAAEIANAVSAVARAAGAARKIKIRYFSQGAGGTAFVTSVKDTSGGRLEERYIYKFDNIGAFLSVCREADANAVAMSDGRYFYLSLNDDAPFAGEFGGKRQSDDELAKLTERLYTLKTDVAKLGELAL